MIEFMGKELNLKWVSDVIGDDYKKWKKGDIVTIKAQTGTGKTYFIKNVMIPNIEDYEKILLVCNRKNLKRQLKKDLFDHYNIPIPKTFKELDEVSSIGNVTIMSYQTLAELKNRKEYGQGEFDLSMYDYIICDECHFFLSDSGFNNKCDLAFMELIRGRHINAIKIFISATMDEVKTSIIKSVEDIKKVGFGSYSRCNIHDYDTEIDYSYLDVKYFKKIKDIIQLIKNDKTDDKWLIFVTSKDKGNAIVDELNGICECSFITKDTKIDECDDLKGIINSSKFNSKVLVCTKAMDNGINIEDEKLKNIVIMSYDKTTFIQELGRIRFDINDAPIINLYIHTRSYSTFTTLLEKKIEPTQAKIEEFNTDKVLFNMKYDRNFHELPSNIFIKVKDGNFDINLNGHARLLKDKYFVEGMIESFKVDKDFAFIKEQLSWLGLEDTFDVANLIVDVISLENADDLEKFLKDSYENEILYTKEFFVDTINAIIEADDNLRVLFNKLDGGNSRSKGAKAYNKLFSNEKINLPYTVGSKKTTLNGIRKNYWMVLFTNN